MAELIANEYEPFEKIKQVDENGADFGMHEI